MQYSFIIFIRPENTYKIKKTARWWNKIISDAEFKKYFTVKGAALKNVPAGYDKEHPQSEYLKYKSWYLEYFMSDEEVCDAAEFLKNRLPFSKL